VRVAVVAEWYPSRADPVLGIWAHRQALAARDAGAEVRVLALRRPVPPLSVARQVVHVPPAIGPLRRWAAGARSTLRPMTLDGLPVTPVAWVGPPRPLS
jgi:teichuronic acid biosynthesis glycosyltransferase TuaC